MNECILLCLEGGNSGAGCASIYKSRVQVCDLKRLQKCLYFQRCSRVILCLDRVVGTGLRAFWRLDNDFSAARIFLVARVIVCPSPLGRLPGLPIPPAGLLNYQAVFLTGWNLTCKKILAGNSRCRSPA
jgi:hypothetical protein